MVKRQSDALVVRAKIDRPRVVYRTAVAVTIARRLVFYKRNVIGKSQNAARPVVYCAAFTVFTRNGIAFKIRFSAEKSLPVIVKRPAVSSRLIIREFRAGICLKRAGSVIVNRAAVGFRRVSGLIVVKYGKTAERNRPFVVNRSAVQPRRIALEHRAAGNGKKGIRVVRQRAAAPRNLIVVKIRRAVHNELRTGGGSVILVANCPAVFHHRFGVGIARKSRIALDCDDAAVRIENRAAAFHGGVVCKRQAHTLVVRAEIDSPCVVNRAAVADVCRSRIIFKRVRPAVEVQRAFIKNSPAVTCRIFRKGRIGVEIHRAGNSLFSGNVNRAAGTFRRIVQKRRRRVECQG